MLYRSIVCDKPLDGYVKDATVEWSGFSSTALDRGTASYFLDMDGKFKYMFEISGNSVGYLISDYSFLKGEKGN